jgi:hypothetical protein
MEPFANSPHIEPRRSLEGLRMALIRQRWDQPQVGEIAAVVRAELGRVGALARIRPGDEIAITAGSRGIATMAEVLRAVVAAVREQGGRPFIFPAMGSHGGGTAEGQRELLAGLGITEQTIGAPIRATMEVVTLGHTAEGLPVYLDAAAARAAGIIMVNRVKKHTNFDGVVESGLCKMAVIGMGKHTQAVLAHLPDNAGLRDNIPRMARVALARAPILAGLALIENASGGLAELVGLARDEIAEREPALLLRAKELSAKLPFRDLDVAIVERMGKEISGTGMDCYVIGRRRIIGEPEWPEAPRIRSLIVLDLTEASHGNGLGVGLADFTTRRLADKIDWPTTRANILTSGNLERGKLPLVYDTDRDALEAAAFRERAVPLAELKLLCMRSTLHLRYLFVSEKLLEEARCHDDLEIVAEGLPLPWDAQGNWRSPLDLDEDEE